MNCAEYKEKLVENIEGLLTQQQQRQLSEHIKNCRSCQVDLNELTALTQRIASDAKNKRSTNFGNAVLNRIVCEQNRKLKQTAGHHRRLHIRNIFMKNRIKFSAAAIIFIAIGLFMHFQKIPFDGASVALADVAKNLEKIQNCVFEKATVYSGNDAAQSSHSFVYYKKDNVRATKLENEMNVEEFYVDFIDGTFVFINHPMKVFRKRDLTREDIDLGAATAPENIVNLILSKGEYKKLGRKAVDGVPSEGFEFSDKRTLLSKDKEKIENITIRLWVDVNTNLPIRFEVDAVLYNKIKVEVVQNNPQWNVELDEDFFEPKIPDDYIKLQDRGLLGINLEDWPILKVSPDMAAENAGIQNGDVVLMLDDNNIKHIKSASEAHNCLLGKAGEKVSFTVRRGKEVLTIDVVREPLPLE